MRVEIGSRARALGRDPRHFQILAQASFLIWLWWVSDFALSPLNCAILLGAALAGQFILLRLFAVPSRDLRSGLITGLSLCLLFRADPSAWWLFALAGLLSVASKFIIRVKGKHVFNPSNFGIVALAALLPAQVWTSPGQWGHETLWAFFFICLGALVLLRARRMDTTLFFLAAYGLGLAAYQLLWLGNPPAIFAHYMQSGALLLFAFFMISDPMATPDSRLGRLVFATSVAWLALVLQHGVWFQMRGGVFYALFIVSAFVPVIDHLLPALRYRWLPVSAKGVTP